MKQNSSFQSLVSSQSNPIYKHVLELMQELLRQSCLFSDAFRNSFQIQDMMIDSFIFVTHYIVFNLYENFLIIVFQEVLISNINSRQHYRVLWNLLLQRVFQLKVCFLPPFLLILYCQKKLLLWSIKLSFLIPSISLEGCAPDHSVVSIITKSRINYHSLSNIR